MKSNWGSDTTLGRTPFSNLLAQNASLLPYFDISLERTGDLDPLDGGNVIFGDHLPGYVSVEQAPVLENVIPYRWTTYVDGMSINGQNIPFGQSSTPTTPPGKLVAMVDTGTTDVLLSKELADAIHANILGAVPVGDVWFVPCAGAANITFVIGFVSLLTRSKDLEIQIRISGQEFPVHPLDLTFMVSNSEAMFSDKLPMNATLCISQYRTTSVLRTSYSDVDMVLGDAFLKNAYVS